MNWKKTAVLSLILNGLLMTILALAWLTLKHEPGPPTQPPQKITYVEDPFVLISPSPPQTSIPDSAQIFPSSFHWSQLESTNFLDYVANLRAIGCPEPTIRDLITAEINLFTRNQFDQLYKSLDMKWWTYPPSLTNFHDFSIQAESIQQNRKKILSTIIEVPPDDIPPFIPDTRFRLALGREFWESIGQESGHSLEQLIENITPRSVSAAGNAGPKVTTSKNSLELILDLDADTRKRIIALAGESGLEEIRLRYSPEAEALRKQLSIAKPTADEFRAIFRDLDIGKAPGTEEILKAIATHLPEEDVSLIKKSGDPVFVRVVDLVDRAGIDRIHAEKIHSIESLTDAEIMNIRNEFDNADPAQLDALLKETRALRSEALLEFLSHDDLRKYETFKAYRQTREMLDPESQ